MDHARSFDVTDEPCSVCRDETPHRVTIELRAESTAAENAQYARQPYRVSTCLRCDEEIVDRVHSA